MKELLVELIHEFIMKNTKEPTIIILNPLDCYDLINVVNKFRSFSSSYAR